MSASPSDLPNGQPRLAPKGPPPHLRRKPRPVDPLVARKKPKPKPQPFSGASPSSQPSRNGLEPEPGPAVPKAAGPDKAKLMEFTEARNLNGGWTDAPPPGSEVRDFPLVTTKRALLEGIRFHVMRFARPGQSGKAEQDVDPTNQDDFTRPVSLHRRDPRQPPPGRALKDDPPTPAPAATVDEKEAERLAQLKADRVAQRALDMAQVAPAAARDASSQKRPAAAHHHQKERRNLQTFMPKRTPQAKKEQEIRYEEALPWHLEDADGKNVWVGTYISALSEANVAFVISGPGFRMVPLEKYYRFTAKPPFQSYSVEEAERIMGASQKLGRWAIKETEKKKAEQEYEATRLAMGGGSRVKQESSTYRSAPRSEKVDQDEIDMEDDEFQDDDENVGLEPENDEDSKDTRERMRRNQLGANLFGDADEQEVEKEEADQMMAELKRKLDGKKLKKAIIKREGHMEYRSESDDEDFMESSVSIFFFLFSLFFLFPC